MTYTETPVPHASMDEVVMDKARLVETLQANREAHRSLFEEALVGYRARAVELLNDHIDRIKKGKIEKVQVFLPIPEDHTDDYDRALTSLEWSIYDTVELSMREFDAYVRDNWAWKQEFVGTTSLYTG